MTSSQYRPQGRDSRVTPTCVSLAWVCRSFLAPSVSYHLQTFIGGQNVKFGVDKHRPKLLAL